MRKQELETVMSKIGFTRSQISANKSNVQKKKKLSWTYMSLWSLDTGNSCGFLINMYINAYLCSTNFENVILYKIILKPF